MIIHSADFVISNTEVEKCPAPNLPEYAFIGRSNVGKSSLINMLTNHKKLAKTSGKPGKTQLINHFSINKEWYLVDLPGYGYAKTSKTNRKMWSKFIDQYLLTRENLMNTFVLIDSRLEPQKIDLDFMEWCASNGIPFSMVFTKTDKLSKVEIDKNIAAYKRRMLKQWEEMPPYFVTSSVSSKGREEVLDYVEEVNGLFEVPEN
ncbi:ribosome biogenesis GTP-binding protein YihA/YsxC [Brumimicrobium aurantiacum]|uniref:Probable GTP-binding protein EngB n=1 Tax=Brumimicrobium aurantiacum TaxID=1737063 RepID=A0A3E1F174_9FLAO|nr:ribosome biogenesis GTP-binding protein YihA/YsxC [Brumimicrobium aurantiacum]RFC55555.1 YihA family ribosome biogenesis GTP-binding protein [Brumimicrobium aurantiacum]